MNIHNGQFSTREKEVVDLLLQGKSNKQIGLALNISVRTVEFHLKNIYNKLQVTSRAEAILRLGKTTASSKSTVERVETTVDRGSSSAENDGNIISTRRISMKQRFYIIIGSVLAIVLVAGLVWVKLNPNIVTNPPTETATSAETASVTGTEINYLGTDFIIPSELGDRALNEVIQQSTDFANTWPAHTRSILENYPLKDTTYQPQIRVFSTQDYVQMSPEAEAMVNELQGIVKTQQFQADKMLPFLPIQRAAQVMHTQEKFVSFINGKGVRYITLYSQAAFPIQNLSHMELLYTFQGLSSDGKYYVSIVMPVNLKYVTVDEATDSPFPEHGIPFNWDNPNPEDYPNYLEKAVVMLSHKNNPFNPSLEVLDELVQSLAVGVEQ
ncbi:MAG: helix-turn-helix transcriptional regulator [Anaerolineales bacterium]|nr:helix-turn-helix transcriptional regulator [Anaerolineales bacterium]